MTTVIPPATAYQQITWAALQEQLETAIALAPKERVLQPYFAKYPAVNMVLEHPSSGYFGLENDAIDLTDIEATYTQPSQKKRICFDHFDGIEIPYVNNFFHRVISFDPDLSYPNSLSVYLNELHRVLRPLGQVSLWLPLPSDTDVTQAIAIAESSLYDTINIEKLCVITPNEVHEHSVLIELRKPAKKAAAHQGPSVMIMSKRIS
ncbi:hypothetical protein SAMN05216480_11539 [Pustulibacterium marinum]|uniref:Methyltransferase type 11 domain-containing protein n=1 Tax=Pustulibacterium marinum TaxID=1224947 RepID=A0A1I7IDL4_9FLAO|nr:hypothetical protein [Pustulibacterium marinum]SFU71039.1 hypothetical protein SAMN05216480_11539 [Pustulibacterium marinum]